MRTRFTLRRPSPLVSTAALRAQLAGLRAELERATLQVAEAEESNARFRLVARATNDILYDWDVRTGEIVWNDALRTLLRFNGDSNAASISWWATQIHPEDSDRVSNSLDAAMKRGDEVWTDTYRFSTAEGAWVDIIDRGLFMRDAEGRCIRMIGAMMDVTNRKQLQTRLVLADRLAAVGTMAAGVAHELNNPLTWVLANVRYVEETVGHSLPVSAARALEHAAQGAERMKAIVNDLRVFSKSEGAVGPVDVRATLHSALSIVGSDLRARAELVLDDDTVGALSVLTSEARLAQVLLNLLVNAVQAITPGNADKNRVLVRLRSEDDRVDIRVDDTGSGIPASVRERIFDPFFTTKPPGEGTGLGLSISLQLVQQMGGSIRVIARPGRGTCFSVVLPLVHAEMVGRVKTPVRPEPSARRPRILVVDDEPMIVEMLEQILSAEFEVVGEFDSPAALERLKAGERFDAMLCDVMMPGLTGIELYWAVARIDNEQARRFVFVTGGAATPAVAVALAESGRICVEKPFELQALRAIVRRVCGA